MCNTKLPSVIERLLPLARPGAVSHALRPQVIYALRPLGQINRNKFLSAVMPLILNITETTEIRIAAVTTLFASQPTFLELQQLVGAAVWERNAEVLNYMVTSFRVRFFFFFNIFTYDLHYYLVLIMFNYFMV
jgi:hypothetical protein